ncbi:MAG: hypothetical protein PQJ47_04065 [Sphaerochaetaceae bacterium]|nr:hypothetical protein [Sphaerochaetaceae bacterium]
MNSGARVSVIIILSVLFMSALTAEEQISFKGGYTRAVMIEGKESVSLSQGAVITVGSLTVEADSIQLIGSQASQITASKNVVIKDSEKQIEIRSNALSYDRLEGSLTVDGWVEIEDFANEMIASGGYLLYDTKSSNMLLQVSSSLIRTSDEGIMRISGDSIEYDRDSRLLKVAGSCEIQFKGSVYRSQVTTVNLDSNEITMSGEIEGTIYE